jgi:hypothetical protein
MLSCSEVSRLCASEELRHAPLRRRLGVRFHLLVCTHCRRYLRELRLIGAAARADAQRLLPDAERVEALEQTVRGRVRAVPREPRPFPPASPGGRGA